MSTASSAAAGDGAAAGTCAVGAAAAGTAAAPRRISGSCISQRGGSANSSSGAEGSPGGVGGSDDGDGGDGSGDERGVDVASADTPSVVSSREVEAVAISVQPAPSLTPIRQVLGIPRSFLGFWVTQERRIPGECDSDRKIIVRPCVHVCDDIAYPLPELMCVHTCSPSSVLVFYFSSGVTAQPGGSCRRRSLHPRPRRRRVLLRQIAQSNPNNPTSYSHSSSQSNQKVNQWRARVSSHHHARCCSHSDPSSSSSSS